MTVMQRTIGGLRRIVDEGSRPYHRLMPSIMVAKCGAYGGWWPSAGHTITANFGTTSNVMGDGPQYLNNNLGLASLGLRVLYLGLNLDLATYQFSYR